MKGQGRPVFRAATAAGNHRIFTATGKARPDRMTIGGAGFAARRGGASIFGQIRRPRQNRRGKCGKSESLGPPEFI
jgi:hypothetical protein